MQLSDAIEGVDAHTARVRWAWSTRRGAGFALVSNGAVYIASGTTCRSSD